MQQHHDFITLSHQSEVASPPTVISIGEIPCRTCGSLGPHQKGPGSGPHMAKLICRDCHGFIQWLSTRSPEEKATRAEHFRRQAMANQPPTPQQLGFLRQLDYTGPEPANRLQAHDAIDVLLQGRESRP